MEQVTKLLLFGERKKGKRRLRSGCIAVLDADVVGELGQGVHVALEVRKPLGEPGVHLERRVGVVHPLPGPQVRYHGNLAGGFPEEVVLVGVVIVPPSLGSEQRNGVVERDRLVPGVVDSCVELKG